MRFERLESFIGQIVLHKYHCKGFIGEGPASPDRIYYICDKCDVIVEIDPKILEESAFKRIRAVSTGDSEYGVFKDFVKNLDCSAHPGGTYEELFIAYSVMSC